MQTRLALNFKLSTIPTSQGWDYRPVPSRLQSGLFLCVSSGEAGLWFCFALLGNKPKTLSTLGKRSTTELNS